MRFHRLNFLVLSVIFSFFLSVSVYAQDSLSFKRVKWEKKTLAKGIKWRHFHFDKKELFGSNQNINYIIFDNNPLKYELAFTDAEGDSLLKTSVLAKNINAIAAINGSFFDMKKGGAVDLIRVKGITLDTTRHNRKHLAEHQQSALVIEKNTLKIVRAFDSLNLGWDKNLPQSDVMTTGPLLIFDHKKHPLSISAFNDNRHPRSCVGITEDNKIIWLTVDGRTPQSQGLNLNELTRVMQWLNCRYAINLDGGGSTTLYVENQGVVNMPCDNKRFDHAGERPVSNIIFIKKK